MSRELAEVRTYSELIDAWRAWVAELQTTGETIDEVAGLPARYTAKLLTEIKGFGSTSLGPLLGALGLKIILAVDEPQLAIIRHRLTKRKIPMHAQPMHSRFIVRRWQSKGGRNSRKNMSPARRTQLARKAARARWSTPVVVELTGAAATAARRVCRGDRT